MDEYTQEQEQHYLFDELADDLYELGSVVSAAQYHGMVCGSLVGNDIVQGESWRVKCLDFLGLPLDGEYGADLQRVLALTSQVAGELARQDFGFQLLLPADECELSERATELGNWCQGFLAGLALAGQDQEHWSRLPQDLAEGLSHLVAITQVEVGDGGGETEFMELYEYVRMVVLNACAELRADGDATGAPIHSASALFGGDRKLH